MATFFREDMLPFNCSWTDISQGVYDGMSSFLKMHSLFSSAVFISVEVGVKGTDCVPRNGSTF